MRYGYTRKQATAMSTMTPWQLMKRSHRVGQLCRVSPVCRVQVQEIHVQWSGNSSASKVHARPDFDGPIAAPFRGVHISQSETHEIRSPEPAARRSPEGEHIPPEVTSRCEGQNAVPVDVLCDGEQQPQPVSAPTHLKEACDTASIPLFAPHAPTCRMRATKSSPRLFGLKGGSNDSSD